MPIAMLMAWPEVTQEEYDRAMAALKLDESLPEGGLLHVAGGDGDTWRILDVWESEEAWNRFFETRLVPVLEQEGLTEKGQPDIRIYDVHNVFVPDAEAVSRVGASSLPRVAA